MSAELPESGSKEVKKSSDKNPLETPLLTNKNVPFEFTDKMLEDDFDEVYRNYPLTEDTTCGISVFRGRILQK